jgi:hypothetical protein
MGGLWHYICKLLVNILRVWSVIAFEFFSCCVVAVSYVDVARVVSIAEDFFERGGGPQGVPPPNGGKGVPPPNGGNFVRLVERGVPPPNGGSICLTRGFVFDLANSHYSILVIVHFDHENLYVWWDLFVRYFSRTSIDTFQRTVVCLFVGFLVCGHPLLIFLPGIVVETGAGDEDWGRREGVGEGWCL